MPVKSFVESVTPKKAQDYLDSMVDNRNLNTHNVEVYRKTMERGEWRVNGEAIVLDEADAMLDGQHRCAAVIRYGKPVDMLVVRGVQRSAFDTIDIGRKRTCADVLGMQGVKNNRMSAAVVSVAHRWELGNAYTTRGGASRNNITPHQAIAFLRRWPDIPEHVAALYCSQSKRLLCKSHVAFLRFASFRANKKMAEGFWQRVESGENLVRGTGPFAMRERLISDAASRAKLPQTVVFALCIKCWNAHATGEAIGVLRFGEDESFPDIVGFPALGQPIK